MGSNMIKDDALSDEDIGKREIVLKMLQLMAIDVGAANTAAACNVFMANLIYNGYGTQNARMIAADEMKKTTESILQEIDEWHQAASAGVN